MADRDCIHGQLARQCDYCEKDAEIADLRAQLEQARSERESLIHDLERHIVIAAREADARLKAEAENARLQDEVLDYRLRLAQYEDEMEK